ncbi:MAG: SusC/RagA family TonB-linked outer membrane protein [Bacteroidota bacterium]
MNLHVIRTYFLLGILILSSSIAFAQSQTITGTVTDMETNEVLPGVSVVVKGTSIGTTTDFDGNYKITVSGGSILQFVFMGMETREVKVDNQTVINVSLSAEIRALDDVVVTALGLSREKKSLGYSVAEVKSEELTKTVQSNVMNSLAGKMTGVQISNTGGEAGSSVNVIIRGASSLTTDNQPLYVVDGVPINNSLSGGVSSFGKNVDVDFGSPINDIASEDIESVSVLKGPSAAALYGSRAGNGVVLITTKSGAGSKGKIRVSVTSSVEFDHPYRFLDLHNKFASGYRPTLAADSLIFEESEHQLGPELDKGIKAIVWGGAKDENGNPVTEELVSHPDNIKNFVRTGITNSNNISISGANDNGDFRLSFSNMNNRGIIPNSDFNKLSLGINSTYNIAKKLKLSTNINIGKTFSDNRPGSGRGTAIDAAYRVGFHHDISKFEEYWVPGQEEIQQRAPIGRNNPYFMAYAVNNSFFRNRVYGNLKLDWGFYQDFNFMLRYSLDRYNEQRESKVPKSHNEAPNGIYGIKNIYKNEQNLDFLLSFNRRFSDFSISTSLGGNIMYKYDSFISTSTKRDGDGLIVPGLYNVSNILPSSLDFSNNIYRKAIYSLYAMGSFGFRDMIYLDLTARNDWSSTLPEVNRSYFYPSASLSVLLNKVFNLSGEINLVKLRGGVAKVGNDTDPYMLDAVVNNEGAWGDVARLGTNSTLLLSDLKPEEATSYEIGGDFAFFQNRIRTDFTYYELYNKNQILKVALPSSSGYGTKLINAGLLKSKGIEFSVGVTPIRNGELVWDLNVNFSRNRTSIEELAEGMGHHVLWEEAKGGAITYVGGEIGDIYDRKVKVVEDDNSEYYGWPILDKNGMLQDEGADIDDLELVGNFNPDFTIGFQTSLNYKGFTLSAAIDWRKGGEFVSQTYRDLEYRSITQRKFDNLINPNNIDGELSQYLKDNADEHIKGFNLVGGPTEEMGGSEFSFFGWVANDGVFIPGVIAERDDDGNIIGYTENLGDEGTVYFPFIYSMETSWDFTQASIFDASFVKLREISLGYTFNRQFIKRLGLESLFLSVYSRNILLWSKANIGIDPERAFQPTGDGKLLQGVERFNVNPLTIPIGVKLNLNF